MCCPWLTGQEWVVAIGAKASQLRWDVPKDAVWICPRYWWYLLISGDVVSCDKYQYTNIYSIYIYTHIPSASRTNKFVGFFSKIPVFSSVMRKTVFSQKIWVFSLLGKKHTFSHTWCHDFSWFVPLDDSNPFIDTSLGSIPLSTLHVDYTSTPLALAGSSRKKGPDALGTCRTTLSVITVNLESLDDFFPRTTPRSINWNIAVFFFIGKKTILDCQSPTSSRTKVSKQSTSNKIMKNQSNFSVFNHFGWQF